VKAFFDTSVLVAVFYGDHEHHAASLSLFLQVPKVDACCGAHTLTKIYATLTRMPGKERVTAIRRCSSWLASENVSASSP